MSSIFKTLTLMIFFFSGSVFSSVPGQVNFQGVLLNESNLAVNGNVNFNFALFDAATVGTQLWSENQIDVTVSAGMYTVALGSVVPIAADILSGGTVYLEVSVANEVLSPRQRLLAVPYALKAEDAEKIAGISGIFVQQLFLNRDWDGQSIANDDPLEGVADIDGDGLANFIDPDNDGDGVTDDEEITNGTAVNLVSPTISAITGSFSNAVAHISTPTTITITGTNFINGLTVQVGTETPIPQNVTSTSFSIVVGNGQVAGPAIITVTNPNTEQTTGLMHFYEKLVFVSSGTLADAMHQSVITADAFCTQAATDAGIPGNFIAWFSDPSNAMSVVDRFPVVGGNWARTDGVLVATDLADLTDGSIQASISLDEYGATVPATLAATNTLQSGLFNINSCINNIPEIGTVGQTDQINYTWSSVGYTGCTDSRRYYCFEE